MRYKFGRFACSKLWQVAQYFFTHGDKSIHRFYKIFGERNIAKTLFMRNDIISNTNYPGVFIFFYPP